MKRFLKIALLLIAVLIGVASCDKDEPDGKWDKMKWKAPSDLVELQEGVYQVPLSGGTYTFVCENYEPWIESLIESGPHVSYEYPVLTDNHFLDGQWCSVKCVKKYVTVTFSPTSEDEPHEFEIGFTAGDIFYYMHFRQRNRLY